MRASGLYDRLEQDFPIALCDDDWSEIGNPQFITGQYRKRYMGLVTDSAESIEYAYTAVFPSAAVLERIPDDHRRDTRVHGCLQGEFPALLFFHPETGRMESA